MSKKKSALFIGRWQPLHNGHDFIIRKALDEGKSVLIAVRDTPISEWDPYTVQERIDMIKQTYANEDVEVIEIPDIESVNIGRKVGYAVNRYDAPENIEGISATQIRSKMQNNDLSWKDNVPKEIAKYLDYNMGGKVIWLTGLSGAGKTTIGEILKEKYIAFGKKTVLLDGDEVRQNLTSDLGFSKEDRDENIKRIAYAAKLVVDVNGFAIVCAISPYEKARQLAKSVIGENRFILVHVKADLEVVIDRDVKGLYKKALAGEIPNFTGVSDPYEEPQDADIIVDTGKLDLDSCIEKILKNSL